MAVVRREREMNVDADSTNPFASIRKDSSGEYSRKFMQKGKEVTVSFEDAETIAELKLLLPTAKTFWRDRVKWFKRFHDYAIENLLHALNQRKPENGTKDLTKAEFSKYISVPFSVSFYSEDLDDSDEPCRFRISAGEDERMFDYVVEAHGTIEDGFVTWELVCLL